jgi:hypothetical protein
MAHQQADLSARPSCLVVCVQGQQSAAQAKVLAQTTLLGCKDIASARCGALLKVANAFCYMSEKNAPLCEWRCL